MATFENIIVESKGAVGIVRLNRPKMLNALSFGVFREIAAAIDDLEADEAIGCIVVTGSEKAFAAGADIKEMQPKGFIDMFNSDFAAVGGDRVARCRKPTIAAVSGYALGGGCELAMMCDIIIAADTAKFGQPEITLGTIPGIGGTQRLTRAVGKSKAMDLCLTGRMMDAAEAERSGLVSRVVPGDKLMDEVMAAAGSRDGERGDQPGLRDDAVGRPQCRAQPVSLDLCAGRSLRGHDGLHREAPAGEQE
jgi:enoyl-CoA hydratase